MKISTYFIASIVASVFFLFISGGDYFGALIGIGTVWYLFIKMVKDEMKIRSHTPNQTYRNERGMLHDVDLSEMVERMNAQKTPEQLEEMEKERERYAKRRRDEQAIKHYLETGIFFY